MVDGLRNNAESAILFFSWKVNKVWFARVEHDRSRIFSWKSQVLHGLQASLNLRIKGHHGMNFQLNGGHQELLVRVPVHEKNDI